jgi:predicted nucleotidyltransferase
MINKNALINDFNQLMVEHYSTRLSKIILYGCYAKGDFHKESDIDFLVLLNDEDVSITKEIGETNNQLFDLSLKHNFIPISSYVISKSSFQTSNKALFRFIKKEGITIYG